VRYEAAALAFVLLFCSRGLWPRGVGRQRFSPPHRGHRPRLRKIRSIVRTLYWPSIRY